MVSLRALKHTKNGYQANNDQRIDLSTGSERANVDTAENTAQSSGEGRMLFDRFIAEAERIGLTVDVFAAQLAQHPEFADCVACDASEGVPETQ